VVVVGEEAVVVVDMVLPEPLGEDDVVVVVVALVVELAGGDAVVVAELPPGEETAGAEAAAGFAAEEDGAAIEDRTGALAASAGGVPAGALAPAPDCDPGLVALAQGSAMPAPNG
jgi:hypothetical protein